MNLHQTISQGARLLRTRATEPTLTIWIGRVPDPVAPDQHQAFLTREGAVEWVESHEWLVSEDGDDAEDSTEWCELLVWSEDVKMTPAGVIGLFDDYANR